MPKSKRRKLKAKQPTPTRVPKSLFEPVSARNSETGQDELYFIIDGQRVAKRGHPGTPQAGIWIPLVAGIKFPDEFPDDGRPVFSAGEVRWMPEPEGGKH